MSVAVGCWLKKEEYSTVYGTCTSRSACQCLCYLVLVPGTWVCVVRGTVNTHTKIERAYHNCNKCGVQRHLNAWMYKNTFLKTSTQKKAFHVLIFLEFGVFGRQRLGRSEGSYCQKSGRQRQINTSVSYYRPLIIHQPIRSPSLRTKYSSVAPAITCRKPRNHWTKINLHTSAGTLWIHMDKPIVFSFPQTIKYWWKKTP